MPGMPADPRPNTSVDKTKIYTQEGVLADTGFMETEATAECWACGEHTNKRKPGVLFDIWRCKCGVQFNLRAVPR